MLWRTAVLLAMLVLAAGPLSCVATEQAPPIPPEEQPEVLTSGPVHEAFAEPVNLEPQTGLVVPMEPPAKIEEVPPPERPEGDRFAWVPGYWSWDSDRKGFVWVSACWRAAPPNRSWVPGYWARVPEGWEWVPGFWTPTTPQKIEYLPVAPPIADVESEDLPPSVDYVWVPACPYWVRDQYVRRPGYWLRQQVGWVWVPSHYIRTPRGYVFVAGHWDYALDRRGVLFAPVYFPRPVYARVGFVYRPSIVIDLGVLQFSLFAYPRYSHYYFGDYFDDVYLSLGIFPRFESVRSRRWYDPFYRYDRWQHRRIEPRWDDRERREYDLRRADRDLRPPKTYRDMEIRHARLPEPQRRDLQIAKPLTTVVSTRSTPLTFRTINDSTQKKIAKQSTSVQRFRDERSRWESVARVKDTVERLTGRTGPGPQRTGPGEASPTPTQGRGPATPPAARREPSESRRPAPAAKPDTVPIRRSPVTGKPANSEAYKTGPPTRPPAEREGPPSGRGGQGQFRRR